MDHQQNGRAESGLHAGAEREAGSDCVRGDVGRVSRRRKRHLTSRIKPSTKAALMAQLAAAADQLIHERIASEIALRLAMLRLQAPRPWWHRLMWWRK